MKASLSTPVAGATVNAENPWPGLETFRETDQGFFQGRQTETEELLSLVLRERVTVLFSLSGLGKSSLLQAGLFPRLRPQNILPVHIRFDFVSTQPNLIAQIFGQLTLQARPYDTEAPEAQTGETLWEYFHRESNSFWNARNRPVMPMLVFDQFEEIFTLGCIGTERAAATNTLIEQLADLVECRPPARLKAWLDEHPEETKAFNFGRHYYKVLLGIREDFLPDLETLRSRMPSIALPRMRLRRMNGEAALLVVNQARDLIDPEVAERLVRFVAASNLPLPLAELEIEPALLSLVCRELNNLRQQLNQPRITDRLLAGSQEEVLTNFYRSCFSGLAPEVRPFIEDQFLTVSGFRNSVALDNALGVAGVTVDAINELVERRLLRREDRGGTQRLELTHDLLLGVARTSRDERRLKEQAEKERDTLLRAQEQERLAMLKAKEQEVFALERAQQREKQRRLRFTIGVFAVMTAVSLALAVWAIAAQHRATLERNQAIAANGVAEAARKSSITAQQAAATSASNYTKLADSVQVLSAVDTRNVQTNPSQQPAATLAPRVYLQIVNQDDRPFAQNIRDRLVQNGIVVPGIQYIARVNLSRNDVRYYRKADLPEAQKISDLLKTAGVTASLTYLPGFEDSTTVRPNHYEIWLMNGIGSSTTPARTSY